MYPILTILASLVCASTALHSQALRDSKGRDFWLAVPPNDHSSTQTADPSILALFIATTDTTIVTIDARRRDGTVDASTVTVPPNVVFEFRYPTDQYELRGITQVGVPGIDDERPNKASIHVVTSTDVTMYAVIRDDNTSDAWLVLPADALSTEYIISTYASDLSGTNPLPSQFVLVATEDSTVIDIELSVVQSARNTGSVRKVILNKGESYLLQAGVTTTRRNDDLTGSHVAANKPFVAIASHRRAQVPILSTSASRDCLIEQMPGIDTWGKHIIVPPLTLPSKSTQFNANDVSVCRILASQDSTVVSINSLPAWTVNARKFWDVPLDRPLDIESTKPVLVTIIDRSANRTSFSVNQSGDPSLIVVPPFEQFLSDYRVINVEPHIGGNAFYNQHQITCVVPTSAISSLRIDSIAPALVNPIPGSNFSYATYDVNVGSHYATCDSAFGIIVYGYGPAESYGYTGGMAFQKLFQPSLRLRAMDARGKTGIIDTIAVVVDSIDNVENLVLSGVRSVNTTIRFDPSLFVPLSYRAVSAADGLLHASMSYSFDTLRVGDTVGFIRGIHTLGLAPVMPIQFDTVSWTESSGGPVSVRTTLIEGEIETLDICDDKGLNRLFDPRVGAPRPIRYFDILGRYVGESIDGLPQGVYVRQ